MDLTLRIWRQANARTPGRFQTYRVSGIIPDMSFLEMLDVLNEQLLQEGQDPVAFDHDCREGICGTCSHRGERAAPRAGAGHRPSASSTCASSRTGT